MVNNNIENRIDNMRKQLFLSIENAKNVKKNLQYNLFKFCIIAFVCMFFGFIVIKSTLKTLSLYYNLKNKEHLANKRFNIPHDNNEYLNYENNINYKKSYFKGIIKSRANQNERLKNAKLEMIANSETDQTLKDYKLDAEININSLDKKDDEYEYNPKKNKQSFWSLLFVDKNYENI